MILLLHNSKYHISIYREEFIVQYYSTSTYVCYAWNNPIVTCISWPSIQHFKININNNHSFYLYKTLLLNNVSYINIIYSHMFHILYTKYTRLKCVFRYFSLKFNPASGIYSNVCYCKITAFFSFLSTFLRVHLL